MKYFFIISSVVLSLPLIVDAQTLGFVINRLLNIFNLLIRPLVGLGVVFFIYGLIRYITTTSEETKSEMVRFILYGIIYLFVMVSVWGLVRLLSMTFGLTGGGYVPRDGFINVRAFIR